MEYILNIIIMINIYILLVLSANLPVGMANLLTMGQAAFYGIGAYISAYFLMQFNLPFIVVALAVMILTGLFSFLISFASMKLKGDYFILATLGFQMIVYTVLYNWTDVTRGPYGVPLIPEINILGRYDALDEMHIRIIYIIAIIISAIIILAIAGVLIYQFIKLIKNIKSLWRRLSTIRIYYLNIADLLCKGAAFFANLIMLRIKLSNLKHDFLDIFKKSIRCYQFEMRLTFYSTLLFLLYFLFSITVGILIPKTVGILIPEKVKVYMYFALSSVITVLVVMFFKNIKSSPYGRVLKAIKNDEHSVSAMGRNPIEFKSWAFFLSAAFSGLAGLIYASYVNFIDPTSFTLDESIFIISALFIGGTGNIKGPVFGAVFVVVLPELLRFVDMPDSIEANLRQIIYGLSLIVVMYFRPHKDCGAQPD